jgi:hypothetical protein
VRSSCKEWSETSARSALMRVHSFISKNLRRDIIFLIPVEVREKHRSRARSAQAVESLELINQGES